MSGGPLKPKFLFIVSLSCLLMVGPGYAQRRHSTVKQPVEQEHVVVAQPIQTLAEMPPSPPQVSFQGGQLTISAQNSTLGDILKSVRAQTNATIDLPGNASERVVGRFGPGPARDVLTSLLNGSHFNYLLLGSPTDPNALDRVILMAKSGAAADNNPQPPTEQANAYNQPSFNRPVMPMPAPGGNTVTVEGQDATDDSADDADSSDDAQADDSTDADQADDQQAADDQQQQPDAQPAVKTPEQLLQEMQQRQQQIQQQGLQPGGQPGAPGAPGFPTPGQPGMPPGPPHN